MRNLARNIADGYLTAALAMFVSALQCLLLMICKSNLQQLFVLQRYRPVYLRSGRRNRVRY